MTLSNKCHNEIFSLFFIFIRRYSQTHQICNDTFEIVIKALVLIRVANVVKRLQPNPDESSTHTSIHRWNRFSVKCATKHTHNFQICAGISACTPIVAHKLSVISALKVSIPQHRCRSISDFVIQHRVHHQLPRNRIHVHYHRHQRRLHTRINRFWDQIYHHYRWHRDQIHS